jgi:hypothetical protein
MLVRQAVYAQLGLVCRSSCGWSYDSATDGHMRLYGGYIVVIKWLYSGYKKAVLVLLGELVWGKEQAKETGDVWECFKGTYGRSASRGRMGGASRGGVGALLHEGAWARFFMRERGRASS